ncbi:hypothetical protein [Megasphaera sp.]|uniref:hypothetical protein n=1 Tax=Megasphaera sp. TaxID=2023260 RepID=UPI0025C06C39|nr:hypothetical protein [Megasphaera sp.]
MDKEVHKKPAKINRFNEKWLYMSLPFQSKNAGAISKQNDVAGATLYQSNN